MTVGTRISDLLVRYPVKCFKPRSSCFRRSRFASHCKLARESKRLRFGLELLSAGPLYGAVDERDRLRAEKTNAELVRAVLTDTHFWVPMVVLALGILLLIALH